MKNVYDYAPKLAHNVSQKKKFDYSWNYWKFLIPNWIEKLLFAVFIHTVISGLTVVDSHSHISGVKQSTTVYIVYLHTEKER